MYKTQVLPGIGEGGEKQSEKRVYTYFYNVKELMSFYRRFRDIFKNRNDEILGKAEDSWKIVRLSSSDFTDHLKGKYQLRISPLLRGGKCKFAIIRFEIDREPQGLGTVEDEIRNFAKKLVDLGLYCFADPKIKSGLFTVRMYFSEPVDARKIRTVIKLEAESIDQKILKDVRIEIFPKHGDFEKVQEEDLIEAPYFAALEGDRVTRYVPGESDASKPLNFVAFLNLAEKRLIAPSKVEELYKNHIKDVEDEPVDIPKSKVPLFPLKVLPESVQQAIKEVADSISCPVDLVAHPLVVLAGAAMGTSRMIEVKPGWQENAQVYSATVSQSGIGKSPGSSIVVGPIYKKQKELQNSHKDKMERFEEDMMRYENAVRRWKVNNCQGSPPQKPIKPVLQQLITTDATMESLGRVLDGNPRGIIYYVDELAGWVRSMNQYKGKGGDDRQKWLLIWNIGETLIINRVGLKVPIVVPDPFISVCGNIQPSVLGDLYDERGQEDGLLSRILFSYPDRIDLHYSEQGISDEVFKTFEDIFEKLLSLEGVPGGHDEDHGQEEGKEIKLHVLELTKGAKMAWKRFMDELNAERNAMSVSDPLWAPWGKFPGYCARLALILEYIRWAGDGREDMGEPKEIDETSMKGAVKLIEYYKSHARRVYAELKVSPEDRIVTSAVDWIRKQGGIVTARDVHRNQVAGIKDSKRAKQLFKNLEDRGLGKCHEGKGGKVTFTLLAE